MTGFWRVQHKGAGLQTFLDNSLFGVCRACSPEMGSAQSKASCMSCSVVMPKMLWMSLMKSE